MVFFSSDHKLISRFKDLSPYLPPASSSMPSSSTQQQQQQQQVEKEQDVLCINERVVMVRSKAMYDQPQAGLAGVAVDLQRR